MEVIDIGLSELEPISINFSDGESSRKPSVNFGPGIELLMNDKKRSSSNNINVDLGELDSLENELNELSGNSSSSSGDSKSMSGLSGFASNLFNFGSKPEQAKSAMNNDSNVGHATVESIGSTKTWDGFSKMNDVPGGDRGPSAASANLSDREKRRKKRLMIKKLEEWYEKGLIKSVNHYNLESPYEDVEDEYETALEDKRKKDSIKLQGWWFMTFINSVEYANTVFNPFDLNLDGWGEQITDDIDSYEEIFSELHEKYKGGKMAPELSLLLRLGFSAAVVNFTNKALSTATPGFNDVIKQSPELMKMFTAATVDSMSQKSPGFSMASNLMNNPDRINSSFGPPPAPVETKNQPNQQRPSMNFTQAPGNRPDISAGRGAMFREQGVDMANNYENANQSARPMQQHQQQQPQNTMHRPEMRGPQSADIDNILSGLKTRNVNIHETAPTNDNDSMVSISSLKDMQNTNLPKRSNRKSRNGSEKNTVSLDI
jgi:hypothetical protein